MRILVTGAAGFIGRPLARELLTAGHEVIAFDRRVAPAGTVIVTGYLADRVHVRRVFREHAPEAIVHLAALTSAPASLAAPSRYLWVNTAGTLNLLAAMEAFDVRRLVFASSAAVYGARRDRKSCRETDPVDPSTPYGESKATVERWLRWFPVRSIILRYFNVVGPGDDLTSGHLLPRALEAAARGAALEVCGRNHPTRDGTCVRDYVHVADVVAASAAALGSIDLFGIAEPAVFNVGTGRGRTVLELAREVARVTGRPVPLRFIAPRPGDPPALVASVGKARRALGWRAARSLTDIVKDAWRFRAD